MRAANHHGRGTAKHAGRNFDLGKADHIDPTKTKDNRYWSIYHGETTGERLEADEMRYYRKRFSAAAEAQNEKYRKNRQHSRIRTTDDWYRDRVRQPEGSLLYIGDKSNRRDVPPDVLWACASRYIRWEQDYSKAHGGFYEPLSFALHVDERGQWHVEERGVYQYRNAEGDWMVGQNAALEAAGFVLPEPGQKLSRTNNRKMTWDAVRRKKWLDIVEEAGFTIERQPKEGDLHLPLEAWQALKDAQMAQEAEFERQREEMRQEAERAAEALQEAQEEAKSLREDNERLRRKNAALRASNRFYEQAESYRTYQERIKARLDAPEPVKAPYDQIAPKRRVRGNQEAQRQAERVAQVQEAFNIDYSSHEREDRQL